MKALVVYDSQYGNTEMVARAIGKSIPESHVLRAGDARSGDLDGCGLLVVGSPTQGGRPTAATKQFLDSIPAGGLANLGVTAFDTRIRPEGRSFFLKALMRVLGYAAGRIASKLTAKGGRLVAAPEGFGVEDKEGPLEGGELERAGAWGRTLAGAV